MKIAEHIPESWQYVLSYGYYPVLFIGLVIAITILYRVALPRPLPSHRLLYGAVLAAIVFLVATLGLRVYLTWITGTGYTYGALATPIAFLLFAFFLGFAIMMGAELNAAIQEEWPAPDTHAKRLRGWLEEKADERNGDATAPTARQRAQTPRVRRRGPRLLLELLVDPLAVGHTGDPGLADLVTGNTSPHSATTWVPIDGAFGDLVLLDVVEDLGSVVVGPVVDLFVGVGALDGLGVHDVHCAWDAICNKPDRLQ